MRILRHGDRDGGGDGDGDGDGIDKVLFSSQFIRSSAISYLVMVMNDGRGRIWSTAVVMGMGMGIGDGDGEDCGDTEPNLSISIMSHKSLMKA